jgi:hypothetical protein
LRALRPAVPRVSSAIARLQTGVVRRPMASLLLKTLAGFEDAILAASGVQDRRSC